MARLCRVSILIYLALRITWKEIVERSGIDFKTCGIVVFKFGKNNRESEGGLG